MLNKLFNPDNALMITMAQISDVVFLSLFWLVCCFPVVTVGAATAALYDATLHAFRKGDKHAWSRFFRVFKAEVKNGVVPTLVFLAVFCAGGWGLIQVWNAVALEGLSPAVLAAAGFVGVLVLGVLTILFPLMSRFDDPAGVLVKNAVLLGFVNLPRTLILGFLSAACVLLCGIYILPVAILPGLNALLGTLLLEPMFKPYMPSGDDESAA